MTPWRALGILIGMVIYIGVIIALVALVGLLIARKAGLL